MRLSPRSRCLGVEGSSLSPETGSVSATSLRAHTCIPHKHTRSPNNGQCVERPTCRNGPLLAPPPTLLRGSEPIGASQLFSSMARSAAGLGRPAVWMCAPAQGAGPLGRRGGRGGASRAQNLPWDLVGPHPHRAFPDLLYLNSPTPGSDTESHALGTPPHPQSPRSFRLASPATELRPPGPEKPGSAVPQPPAFLSLPHLGRRETWIGCHCACPYI